MDENIKRITYIDGFRGLAILLVIIFHSYVRWPEYYPFGDTFKGNPFFDTGRSGVWLFFVISGFVITMSLENVRDFRKFLYKRWLRIFPAMLVATILIYCFSNIFTERPNGIPKLYDYISGITFISPELYNYLFKTSFVDIEGSFWSLYVEVGFYIAFGASYFLFGKRVAVLILIALALMPELLFSYYKVPLAAELIKLSLIFGFQHYYLFVVGIFLYEYYKTNNVKYMAFSCFILILAAQRIDDSVISLTAIAAFIISFNLSFIRKFFEHKFWLFLGGVSYPLYLFHEGFIVSFTNNLGLIFPQIPPVLFPVPGIIIAIMVAFLIEKSERRIKKLIEKIVQNTMQRKKTPIQIQ